MSIAKKITKIAAGMHGHLHLEFADGSMQVLYRGTHELHNLAVGDLWDGAQKVEANGKT